MHPVLIGSKLLLGVVLPLSLVEQKRLKVKAKNELLCAQKYAECYKCALLDPLTPHCMFNLTDIVYYVFLADIQSHKLVYTLCTQGGVYNSPM